MIGEGESVAARAWRVWRYIWCALRNLIVIAIALLAFSVAEDRFQTLTLGVLILVLIGVAEGFTLSYRNYLEHNAALSVEFANVGLALNRLERRAIEREEASPEELEELAEQEEAMRLLATGDSEAARYLRETRGFFRINMAGNYIVWLITIWNIIRVTFLS